MSSSANGPGAAARLPDFELPSIHGGELGPATGLTDHKALVVVFWSSVCSHCRRYDGYLSSFAERHPEVGLLAVASRQNETSEQLRRSAEERRLTFAIVHDADRAVAATWQVQQTPRVFLLDPRRRVLYRGAIDNFKYPDDPAYEAYLEPALADFAAGRPIARAETASFGCPVQSVYYDLPELR